MQASNEARATLRRWVAVMAFLFVLGCGAAAFAFDRWMASVDPQMPSLRIVDRTTSGALHFKANPAHAGTREMLEGMTRQVLSTASRHTERLPLLSRFLFSRAQSQMLPSDFTVAVRNGGRQTEPSMVAAVNLQGYPRLMCQIANAVVRRTGVANDAGARDYAGSRMYGEFPTVCLRQGTLLLSSDPPTMQGLLDTLPSVLPTEPTPTTTAPGETGPTLSAALEQMNPADDALGVYDNREDNLGPLLHSLMRIPDTEAQAFSGACARMQAGVAVESADRMTLAVDLIPTSRASAPEMQAQTDSLLRRIAEHAREGGLTITYKTSATASVAHADVTLNGLQGALASLQNLMVDVGIVQSPAPAP